MWTWSGTSRGDEDASIERQQILEDHVRGHVADTVRAEALLEQCHGGEEVRVGDAERDDLAGGFYQARSCLRPRSAPGDRGSAIAKAGAVDLWKGQEALGIAPGHVALPLGRGEQFDRNGEMPLIRSARALADFGMAAVFEEHRIDEQSGVDIESRIEHAGCGKPRRIDVEMPGEPDCRCNLAQIRASPAGVASRRDRTVWEIGLILLDDK